MPIHLSAFRYSVAYTDPKNINDLDRYINLLTEKNLINKKHSKDFIKDCLMFSGALIDEILFANEDKDVYEDMKKQRLYYQKRICFNEENWKIVRQNIQDLANVLIKEDGEHKEDYRQAYFDGKEFITDLYNFEIDPRLGLLEELFNQEYDNKTKYTYYETADLLCKNSKLVDNYLSLIEQEKPFHRNKEYFKIIIRFCGALLDEITDRFEESEANRVKEQKKLTFDKETYEVCLCVIVDLTKRQITQDKTRIDYFKKVKESADKFVTGLYNKN